VRWTGGLDVIGVRAVTGEVEREELADVVPRFLVGDLETREVAKTTFGT
jgi:hypothetical protein